MKKSDKAPKGEKKSNPALSRFSGGEVVQEIVPSGAKLKWDDDDEAILKFLGSKDISELVEKKTADEKAAIYLSFCDGRQIVSCSASYKLSQAKFEQGQWYYLHVVGMVETPLNAMLDFEILKLGKDGSKVKFEGAEIVLSDESVARLNFDRLNYPLK